MNKEEQLIQTGDMAEAVLNQDAFNTVINALVEQSFTQFCNTKPEEKEKREASYYHYRALVDVVNTLKQSVSVRDEILAKNDQGDTSQEEA